MTANPRAAAVRMLVPGAAMSCMLAACGSSAPPTPTPQTPSPAVSASSAPANSPPGTPTPSAGGATITLAPGIAFELPPGWTVQNQHDPTYLISADKLTKVLLSPGIGSGDQQTAPPAPDLLKDNISMAQGQNGPPANVGLQLANVQLQPVKTSSAGPWDQVAEQDYTATIDGKSVKGIFQLFENSKTMKAEFLQSISTPDVTFSNGVNSIIATLASDSHPS